MTENRPTPPALPPVGQESTQTDNTAEQLQAMQQKIDELQQQVDESTDGNDDGSSIWGEIIFTMIAAIVLWILCPSQHKMEAEISRSVYNQVLTNAAHITGLDEFRELLDIDADNLDDDEVIEKVEQLGEIEVKNYLVVKLGYFKKDGKKTSRFAGIGICGFVITRDTFIEAISS